jgi:hypothetical protein
MCKVFSADFETDVKIIGRSFPQIKDSDTEELFNENDKFNNNEKFLSTSDDCVYSVNASKGTILTDVLSSFMTVHSPLISEKMLSLLRKFTLPKHKVLPLTIFRNKMKLENEKYFIIHFIGNEIENVNFVKSKFEFYVGGKDRELDTSILHFNHFEDFLTKAETDSRINMAKVKFVVMKKSLEKDIFFLDRLNGSTTFISERLKEALVFNGISGLKFRQVGLVE